MGMGTPALRITGWGGIPWLGERGAWERAEAESRAFYGRLAAADTRADDRSQVVPRRVDVGGSVDATLGESAAGRDLAVDLPEGLRENPGGWFVVHTYAGMETRVKANLERRIDSLNLGDYIHEVVVPEDAAGTDGTPGKSTQRAALPPGYVLVRMELNDESWDAVRNTPLVTGFLGHAHRPVPVSPDQVATMLAPAAHAELEPISDRVSVGVADFDVADSIVVLDGPFASLHARITEINAETQRVRAIVELFGRETPIELAYAQIEKDQRR